VSWWPVALVALAACGGDAAPAASIRFLHTFGPAETELFNAIADERRLAVESSLVPFARGQQVIREILVAGTSCPDLIRIDATWLPGLRAELTEVPPDLAALDWTPEAAALVDDAGPPVAVPHSVDGLVVVRDRGTPAPASSSIDDLVAAARAHRRDGYPLGLRVDGYWVVPWLRAEGVDLQVSGALEEASAIRALERFSALFGDVAAPPPPAGSEAPGEIRRWHARELVYWVTGPWQLGVLDDRPRIAVTPLARAPRGGQLLVVPRCAKRPADGWKLAAELTDTSVELRFAETFAIVPSRTSALTTAPALVRDLYAALRSAEPLPRDPRTPLLFDDLNPALAAVIARDATAEEAIAGVRRAWRRLAAWGQP
jgi:ABC-type glycerol-3-phosphate transport system substrate-binding protein